MKRYYQIAGLTVTMESFGRTVEQAEAYACEPRKKVDIDIVSTLEKLKARFPDMDDDIGEYLCTGFNFYKQLLNFDGMMLHSSAVVVDDKAYLFTAPSGTGKSTHTGLWMKLLKERGAYILNDDKPALRLEDGVWYAYGTPWSGKYDISADRRVPVGGIAVITQSDTNSIVPYSGRDAILEVLSQINRPRDTAFRIKLLELLDKLFTGVPVWKLSCNMDIQAAVMSYETMTKKREISNED